MTQPASGQAKNPDRNVSRSKAASDELNIVFIGDSITQAGYLKQTPPAATAIAMLELGARHVEISNQGLSGQTTVDFLPERHTLFDKVERETNELVRRHAGALVFSIMLGTNDSAERGPTGSPVSPSQYRANLSSMIDRLLTDYPDAKLVVHRPTWYSPNTHNGALYMQAGLDRLQSYPAQIDAIIARYRRSHPGRVCAGDRTAFDFFKANSRKYLNPEAGQDGVFYLHPNEEGSQVLGTFWAIGITDCIRGAIPNGS